MVINFPAPTANCEQILWIGRPFRGNRAWFSDMKATDRFVPLVEEMDSGVHRRMRMPLKVERIDPNALVWEPREHSVLRSTRSTLGLQIFCEEGASTA